MKKIVLVLGLMLLCTPAFGQSAVATWNPVTVDINNDPETIAYYTLYYGTSSRPGNVLHPSDGAFAYDAIQDVGNVTQYQVDNLTNGDTYYFSVVAVDIGGNVSDYSSETSYVVPDEDCNNLQDDDHDGLTDCQDTECGNQTEACDGFDNDCDGTPDNNLTGPDCPLQVGVCNGSTQSCSGGTWQACDASSYGNDYEDPEASCDGLDNDCDDQTDEDLTAELCDLQLGVCNGSTKRCGGSSGWLDCDASDYGGSYEAAETLCDGLDNDCDDQTDEDCPCNPGETQACGTGKCAGTQTCEAGGNWGACDGPSPDPSESCNNIDDDCDGTTDEDLTAPACALQSGVCSGSVQTCGGAAGWQACDAATYGNDYEADEASCDGLDNDCDDSTDEALTGSACPLQQGVCAGSTQACSGGSWQACDASSYGNDYEATETSCDSLDNDCDGTTDDDCPCTPNDTQTCSSNEGECVEGTQTCDAGGTWGACDGTLPREETCDGLDNDCDTQTDEDLTGLPCPLQDGVCAGVAAACGGTEGWVCSYGATYEESETLCDDLDNDCDGDTDEDCGEDVVEGSCGCGTGNAGLALLPLFLLVFIIRRR
jgi:hypothetical protein